MDIGNLKLFDYGKSFVITNGTGNSPRFLIEAKCRFDGKDYYLGAKCKGENTFADKELFKRNSFEFYPLFSEDETIVFRRFGYYLPFETGEYKKIYRNTESWGDKEFIIKEAEPTEPLDTSEKIISAIERCVPIMGRLVYGNAIMDFPVKTINRRSEEWQVDTGPIPFPVDYSFGLAFIAFNSFKLVEVIIDGLVRVGNSNLLVVRGDKVITIKNPEIYLYAVNVGK